MNTFSYKKDQNSIKLSGTINEYTDFSDLLIQLKSLPILDFKLIDEVSGFGLRSLINSFTNYKEKIPIKIINCSKNNAEKIIEHISGLNISFYIESVLIPYTCTNCNNKYTELFDYEWGIKSNKNNNIEVVCKCENSIVLNKESKAIIDSLSNMKEQSKKIIPLRGKDERKPFSTKVKVYKNGKLGTFFYLMAENIGEGGIFISGDIEIPTKSELHLEFNIPNDPEEIKCKGEILWKKKTVKTLTSSQISKNGVGIRFLQLDEESKKKISDYIKSFYN